MAIPIEGVNQVVEAYSWEDANKVIEKADWKLIEVNKRPDGKFSFLLGNLGELIANLRDEFPFLSG